ncbi:hypothetical protein IV203_005178 [Nitzschia inconspicua]|uniref:F-box domain-containing protein n=1 Tax=Nitzschia inconspicua TaxID=303405 RepID=A0A9K3KNB3_9STRA|nr:hypothetical protein IV203_005178 [Nitzschia inconspicua]
MSWEAANLPKATEVATAGDGSIVVHPGTGRQSQTRRSGETVEAALSRLSKAYNTSMECIGAMHKTDEMIQLRHQTATSSNNDTDETQQERPTNVDPLAVVHRLANAARKTLESSILLDPLIIPHAPTLHQCMVDLYEEECESSTTTSSRWSSVKQQRSAPPSISSATHKSTLIQLAYLSLVNYSDLLQASCPCYVTSANRCNHSTILDRGIVPKHKSLLQKQQQSSADATMQLDDGTIPSCQCCSWKPEIPEETQRLAVAALCDASNLRYASDPILWLKLACASRCLERVVAVRDNTTVVRSHHRRLQRHALERGSVALPSHMPPNRVVLRALGELIDEPDPHEYISKTRDSSSQIICKTLDLPRCSWTVLGRMLLRACKGEDTAAFQPTTKKQARALSSMFGSPRIDLRLSPMLMLPQKVLGTICQFLNTSSIWKLEATCRALSVSLVSARASMQELDDSKRHQPQMGTKEQESGKIETSSAGGLSRASSATSGIGEESKANNDGDGTSAHPPPVPARQSSRSSKRLISQQISSEKKNDRERNRKSFDYCFLAATLSCTKEEHDKMIKELQGKVELAHLYEGGDTQTSRGGNNKLGFTIESPSEVVKNNLFEARERISHSSLTSFVERWGSKNSGPMDVLEKFLSHVSMHVEDVFSCEPGSAGTMGLSSCIISCFEQLLLRSGSHQTFAPQFYRPLSLTNSFEQSMGSFAMDLLYAELVLRECDRNTPSVVEFDDDENLISLMVPGLMRACNDLDKHFSSLKDDCRDLKKQFRTLQIRCLWLGAGFYLWRSRVASEIYESRQAEEEGTFFLDEAIRAFEQSASMLIKSIRTPQLVSPGRIEPYWKQICSSSLSKFRDEIQSSSVISAAKQQFQELVTRLDTVEEAGGQIQELSDEELAILDAIGQKLRGRYSASHGSADSKLPELVDNFLALHGVYLSSSESSDSSQGHDILLSLHPVDISSLRRISNPSTLSMLFFCLTVRQDRENQNFLLKLLMNLVLTTIDIHDSLTEEISRIKAIKRHGSSGYNSEDDSSDSDEDSLDSYGRNIIGGPRKGNEMKAVMCGKMVIFLLTTLKNAIESLQSSEEQPLIVIPNEFVKVLDCVLSFSNKWYQSTGRLLSFSDDSTDQQLFRCVVKLVDASHFDGQMAKKVDACLFKGMVRILTSHGSLLKQFVSRSHRDRSDGSSRSSRQRACLLRVQFICEAASKLGLLFSTNMASVEKYNLVRSNLFGEADPLRLSTDEEALFVDIVRWLREFSSRNYEETSNKGEIVCPSFERPMVRRLRIPICTLVVGMCGSASKSRKVIGRGEDPIGLSEFFDSDASATDWQSDKEDADNDGTEYRKKKELLRVICHAIHSISITLDRITDKDSIKHFLETDCDKEKGPLLPLVCARVLNFFADELLLNFGNTEMTTSRTQLLWSTGYPYHAQDEGEFLDSVLHKIYRWMYGFVIVGEWDHVQNSGGKDLAHTLNSIYEISKCGFKPESTGAASQLYRCIVRAYAAGRRTPPKAALELVLSALPPMRESERSKALRNFIFSPNTASFSLEKLVQLVKKRDDWDSAFNGVRYALLIGIESNGEENDQSDDMEALRVRRGISARLASGPLPLISTDMGQKSDSPLDDRALTSESEEEIKKKFNAILDDICLGGADCGGWYRAAQCLNMKADVIADRLGLSLGFGRISNFSAPTQGRPQIHSIDIDVLLDEQKREEECSIRNHLDFFGCELSAFVEFAWSSFSSLRECSEKIGQRLNQIENSASEEKMISIAVLRQIESHYKNGEYLAWQEAWGGIYVAALRHLALRFMSAALFILHSKVEKADVDEVMISEVCEACGISVYSELMASQRYGWPMDRLTLRRKRDLAAAAKACFQTAATIVENSSEQDDDSQGKATWDLLFMAGKCEEKMAWTYQRASYPEDANGNRTTRLYEKHMAAALKHYADALKQAKKIENDGRQLADQAGGSAHGSIEVLYRLHASRLKCLIHAVSRNMDELVFSELEALRLTEKYSFVEDTQVSPSSSIRDRVWAVFADIVQGLADCRQKQPYFHRSVYRHAQALMWSPVLNDPTGGAGSMNTVPATRSFAIRGLNNSTPAAVSAGVVMSKLFDKKRSHLCAVWVTSNAASSPFQVLNTAVRKYDSLRGKYIKAYLEAMHLCRRRPEIEIFEKWVYACKRDLPSYFQASALNEGNRPTKPHSHDPLLITTDSIQSLSARGLLRSAKRDSNGYLAHILLQEMNEKLGNGESKPSADVKKVAESYLKHAYACYLRLNCTREDLEKTRAFKYGGDPVHEVEALCQAFLYFGEPNEVASTEFGDWSGGGGRKSAIFDAALIKCKELFPSVSSSFFSKKGTAKSNKDSSNGTGGKKRKEAPVDLASPTSPSAHGTKKISFEVNVPKGLTTGDTFLTQVKVGEGDPIKVKLTVPAGNPTTLRFNLDVPKSSTRKITKKAKMSL